MKDREMYGESRMKDEEIHGECRIKDKRCMVRAG